MEKPTEKKGWLKRRFYRKETMPPIELIEYLIKEICKMENAIDNLGYDLDYNDRRERQILYNLTEVTTGMVNMKSALREFSEQTL